MEQEIPSASSSLVERLLTEGGELLGAGGPVLYVLAALSVLALAIVVFKILQFVRLGLGRSGAIDGALAAWKRGEGDRALGALGASRNPVAVVMAQAIRGRMDGAMERADLEETLARHGAAEIASLRSMMRMLELIATLAPLLGLLGTVLGMIDAFQALEAAGNRVNPAILSGGIWVALLTTAAGLVVAIPAAAAHNLLEGAIERAARTMEDVVTQVLVAPAGVAALHREDRERPRLVPERRA